MTTAVSHQLTHCHPSRSSLLPRGLVIGLAMTALTMTATMTLACGGLVMTPGADDDQATDKSSTTIEAPPAGPQSTGTGTRPPRQAEDGPNAMRQGTGGRGRGGAGHGRQVDNSASDLATLKNPSSGASLQVYVDKPEGDGPFPAVVMMPAGSSAGESYPAREELLALTARGFAVVRWDPDGRGRSTGTEDTCGQVHQEGFREVIRYAIGRDDIIDTEVGVVSYSFGITAATTALAIDNPGAVFLLDWEGPSSRNWTAGCGKLTDMKQSSQHGACDDETYWQYREAATYAGKLRVPYQRVQTAHDHVHGEDWGHAKEMVDNAMAGGDPWVRLNDAAVNTPTSELSSSDLPNISKRDRGSWVADYVEDLFMVAKGQTPPKRDHAVSSTESSARQAGERSGGPRGGPGARGGPGGRGPRGGGQGGQRAPQ